MRDNKIDFYKGMLMIGVIWGHAINAFHLQDPCQLHRFFRIYDMPFFMLLSGIFLAVSVGRYDLKKLLLDKVTTLLIPLVVWDLIRIQKVTLLCYYFIPAVFFSSAIIIVANLLSKNSYVRWFLYLLPIVLLHCTDERLSNLAYLYPFFLAGYAFFDTDINIKCCKSVICKIRRGKYKDLITLFLFAMPLCFWDNAYNPWNTGFNMLADYTAIPIYFFRFYLGIMGVLVMKWVFDKLYDLSLSTFVCHIGRKTFGIYFLQGIIVEMIFSIAMSVLDSHFHISNYYNIPLMCYILAPIIALITCQVSLYIISLIEKSKYTKWILGFKIKRKHLWQQKPL